MSKRWLGYLTTAVVALNISSLASADTSMSQLQNFYSGLTAAWWQWAEKTNAFNGTGDFDAQGRERVNCHLGQSGSVWYLAGAFRAFRGPDGVSATNGDEPITRICTAPVPAKRFFFPLINAELSTNDCAESSGLPGITCPASERRQLLNDIFDGTGENLFFRDGDDSTPPVVTYTCQLDATVDGRKIQDFRVPIVRVQSDRFPLADDPASIADGYWALIPVLAAGPHEISFAGAFCNIDAAPGEALDLLRFKTEVTYQLIVHN